LTIIELAHTASVTLVLASSYEDLFALQRIERSLVHVGKSSATSLLLACHVLIAQNLNVSCLLHEDSIGMLKCFVPQENNILVNVLDDSLASLAHTGDHLHDIVVINCISFCINCLLLYPKVSLIKLFTDLIASDIANSSFLID
jgi:hypothetical protein